MLPIRKKLTDSHRCRTSRTSAASFPRRAWLRFAAIAAILTCLSGLWAASRLDAEEQPPATSTGMAGPTSTATTTAAPKAGTTPAEEGKAAPGYGSQIATPAAAAAAPAAVKPPPPPPVDLVPCRVQIRVGFDTDPFLAKVERQQFLDDLAAHASRWIGDLWQVEIVPEPQLSPGTSFVLERMTAADFQQRYASHAKNVDKVFLLTLETVGAGYRLAAREWDVPTQQFSPMRAQTTYIEPAIAATAFQVLHDVYRPIVKVEVIKNGNDQQVKLRAFGGDFVPPDPNWLPLRSGSVFEGYTRVLDKEKVVQRIQSIPWSYITVGKIIRGVAETSIVSALGKPFFGQKRRSEQVALEIRRQYPVTALKLTTRGSNPRPQTGLEVEIVRGTAAKTEVVFRGLSNRLGVVQIPVDLKAENPQVWLVIRSSLVPLAKIPYIPGIHAQDELQLPDDTLRLKVEGELTLMQADIVDSVARREVMRATAAGQRKSVNVQKLDQMIAELNAMPTGDMFSAQLSALQVSSTAQAKARRDRIAETRINKLCKETAELISKHMAPERISAIHEELVLIRQEVADNASVEKQREDAIKEGNYNTRRKPQGK